MGTMTRKKVLPIGKRWNNGGRLIRMSVRRLNVYGTRWWVSERKVEGKERLFFIRLAHVLRTDCRSQSRYVLVRQEVLPAVPICVSVSVPEVGDNDSQTSES